MFKSYLDWVYGRNGVLGAPAYAKQANLSGAQLTIHAYIEFHVLAEYLQDEILRTRVIGFLFGYLSKDGKSLPGAAAVTFVYDNTREASTLRTFMVDIWVELCARDCVARLLPTSPPAFVLDLAVKLAQQKTQGIWDELRRCVSGYGRKTLARERETVPSRHPLGM